MDIDITSLLANFTIAAIILWMSDRERKVILERITDLEARYDALVNRYITDSAAARWSRSDTRPLPPISDEDKQRFRESIGKE